MPYSLASLQIDAGRKLGMSAAQVLEVAQRLYEQQLTDLSPLRLLLSPRGTSGQARGIVAAVAAYAPALTASCVAAELDRRGRACNDAKVTAHHAIIPTGETKPTDLTRVEQALYELAVITLNA